MPALADVTTEVGLVSESMANFVENTALAKSPQLRCKSAADMADSLVGVLRAKPGGKYDVFISYRVWCDQAFAHQLFKALSKCQVRRLQVYLDKVRLVDGKKFDQGFCEGLANSHVFGPIISAKCLRGFVNLSDEDTEDFVLCEWIMAVELYRRNILDAVLPIILGDQQDDGQSSGKISALGLCQLMVASAHYQMSCQ